MTSSILVEVVVHHEGVGTAFQAQNQVVARANDLNITGRNAGAKLDGIYPVRRAIAVRDGVVTPPTVEAIDIRPVARIQPVVTRTTFQDVVTVTALKGIVTNAAQEDIIACPAIQPVVTGTAYEQIIPRLTRD